jgi:prevent-host-death family protein
LANVTKQIGAFEAKSKLGQLLDWVEAGEEVLITRRGKLARLAPHTAGFDRERSRAAARRIRDMRILTGLRVKDLINEGRR